MTVIDHQKENVVWGSEIYEAHSKVCLAGIHSDQIGYSGGNVSFSTLKIQNYEFIGSEKHGVKSNKLLARTNSYAVLKSAQRSLKKEFKSKFNQTV